MSARGTAATQLSRNAHPAMSVVVLGWNGEPYIRDCLMSLADQDLGQPYAGKPVASPRDSVAASMS